MTAPAQASARAISHFGCGRDAHQPTLLDWLGRSIPADHRDARSS